MVFKYFKVDFIYILQISPTLHNKKILLYKRKTKFKCMFCIINYKTYFNILTKKSENQEIVFIIFFVEISSDYIYYIIYNVEQEIGEYPIDQIRYIIKTRNRNQFLIL